MSGMSIKCRRYLLWTFLRLHSNESASGSVNQDIDTPNRPSAAGILAGHWERVDLYPVREREGWLEAAYHTYLEVNLSVQVV